MKQTFFVLSISMLLLQAFSCKSSKPTSTTAPSTETNPIVNNAPNVTGGSELLYMYRWYLSEVNGKPVRSEGGRSAHLLFSPGQVNTVAGFTGCNRLSGTFTLNGNHEIKFSPLAVTKMACLNDDKTESLFLPAISETNRWQIENNVLKFFNGQTVVATFTAVEAATSKLDGNWELNYISGIRIAFEGLYPEKKPFIRFELGQSMISGNTSCNGFSSNYTMNGNSIRFAPGISTMMACPGNGEKTFTEMLQKVNKYALSDDNTLNFMIDDVAVMRFVRK
ncbi:META domain-containing protein [Lacibacter sp.]|uniref:META domain-containing protein n=1 Tax=Lacibacter sp. TaxID=1915409 RepID=UPI002B4B29A5|nr:META domain-containing protein [Lacibacter sp.]HLP38904.1 META domain-containing protein [Lacibacter sp.]